MGRIKNLLFATRLPIETEMAFEAMIDQSLAHCFFGGSTTREGPVNPDHARKALIELWGDYLCDKALDSAFARFLDQYN
ncbi:MAG: hypothetical protein C5B58_11775 [Acidobacteria bacterium]|nr:MAG: hypothetical protein C5B58_11775 [Acidobacteriota bacterium]